MWDSCVFMNTQETHKIVFGNISSVLPWERTKRWILRPGRRKRQKTGAKTSLLRLWSQRLKRSVPPWGCWIFHIQVEQKWCCICCGSIIGASRCKKKKYWMTKSWISISFVCALIKISEIETHFLKNRKQQTQNNIFCGWTDTYASVFLQVICR